MTVEKGFEPSAIPPSWFRASTVASPLGARIGREMDRPAPLQDGERVLGPFVLPPFQRPPVWSREQQVRFIESCWLGLPIGVYVVNIGEYGSPFDLWLLDGQQRITAILNYMADAFPVYGKLYSELPIVDHRAWNFIRTFTCLETQLEDEAELREVYDRLAHGGTPHEPRHAP
jgi:uncharacterized protein with ParB-like and HNH nuclease domain